jgi:hypothetical protein
MVIYLFFRIFSSCAREEMAHFESLNLSSSMSSAYTVNGALYNKYLWFTVFKYLNLLGASEKL